MDHPSLPTLSRIRYIVPKIKITLISIRQLCAAGCQVLFTNKQCIVFYKNEVMMEGPKDPVTQLLMLPISTNANEIYETEKYKHIKPLSVQHHPNFSGSITFIKTKSELIQYYHQCVLPL